MRYDLIISGAWKAMLSRRLLWIIGLFAGSEAATFWVTADPANSAAQFSAMQRAPQRGRLDLPDTDRMLAMAGQVVAEHLPVIIAFGAFILFLTALLLCFNVLAQGAMAWASVEAAGGRPTPWRAAWSAGSRLFGRFMGLCLLALVPSLAIMAVLMVLTLVPLANLMRALITGTTPTPIEGSNLIPLAGALLLAVNGVGTVLYPYAQRIMVADGVGPIAAVVAAWALFCRSWKDSLVLWLISVVLGIGIGIGIVLAFTVATVAAFIIGALLGGITHSQTMTTVYLVTALPVAAAAIMAATGASAAFHWHYWTLAFLQLRGEAPTTTVEPPAPSPATPNAPTVDEPAAMA